MTRRSVAPLADGPRSKRKRNNKTLRDDVVPRLVDTGRLLDVDRDNLLAVRDAVAELAADWAKAVATCGGRDLIARTGKFTG